MVNKTFEKKKVSNSQEKSLHVFANANRIYKIKNFKILSVCVHVEKNSPR